MTRPQGLVAWAGRQRGRRFGWLVVLGWLLGGALLRFPVAPALGCLVAAAGFGLVAAHVHANGELFLARDRTGGPVRRYHVGARWAVRGSSLAAAACVALAARFVVPPAAPVLEPLAALLGGAGLAAAPLALRREERAPLSFAAAALLALFALAASLGVGLRHL